MSNVKLTLPPLSFACFLLSPLFFQRYQAPSDQSFRCKMPIKSVQAVFKSLASLDRSVEKCRIQLNSEKSRLTITLHCKHGKMHFLLVELNVIYIIAQLHIHYIAKNIGTPRSNEQV
uniref:Uncharacterized protein n=1 Tax=Sinocyclocheilus rhinocerous TaxID=307959 RepID=A0A673IY19_9TELE